MGILLTAWHPRTFQKSASSSPMASSSLSSTSSSPASSLRMATPVLRFAKPQHVMRSSSELPAVVQKRFGFLPGSVELYAEKVQFRGLCAVAQAEALKFKLLGGLAVRRACYGVIRNVMESGAQGVEVIVSGKLRGQRAKAMIFN